MTSIQPAPPARRGRPRLAERTVDMREAAIDAARRICLDVDEGGMTMERVARLLGVRTPSLYHHFPGGKDELLLALADHCSREDGEAIARIVASDGDPLDRLHAVARHFSASIGRHPYRQLTELRSRLPAEARSRIQDWFAQRVEQPLLQLLDEGIAARQFRCIDPEIFVRAFLTLVINMEVFEITDAKRAGLPDFLVDLLVEGIMTR